MTNTLTADNDNEDQEATIRLDLAAYFNAVVEFRLSLPSSDIYEDCLAPETLAHFEDETQTSLPDACKERVEAFLNREEENTDLKLDCWETYDGFIFANLLFHCKRQTAIKLKETMNEVFADIKLSDKLISAGASWKNLHIRSMSGDQKFPRPNGGFNRFFY